MNMSVNNDLSDTDSAPKLRMKPAVSRIFCCSVTAASGFIAAYALVSLQSFFIQLHTVSCI